MNKTKLVRQILTKCYAFEPEVEAAALLHAHGVTCAEFANISANNAMSGMPGHALCNTMNALHNIERGIVCVNIQREQMS